MAENKVLNYEGESLMSAHKRGDYDDSCRRILGLKQIAALVLKDCACEFKDCSVKEIINCIEDVEIGSAPINRDVPTVPLEDTADKTTDEGNRFFDVRFTVRVPGNSEIIIYLIINFEAQKDFYPGYPLVKRGFYNCGRLISMQYGTVFTGSDFGKLRKVYSIWICTNPPEKLKNKIYEYRIVKEFIEGTAVPEDDEERRDADMLSLVFVCLGDYDSEAVKKNGILRLLSVIFDTKVSYVKMRDILENEYKIPITEEVNEEVRRMCNLSEGIREDAIKEGRDIWFAEGRTEGRAEGIAEGIAKGRTEGIAEGIIKGRAEGEAGGIIKGLAEGFKAIMSQGKSFDETALMLNVTADTKQKVRQLLKELGTI